MNELEGKMCELLVWFGCLAAVGDHSGGARSDSVVEMTTIIIIIDCA